MPALRLPRLSSLRAFEHPGYLPVWTGSLVSNIGTWMEAVALGVYVTEVTGRAEWTGGVAALSYLPGLVLSPLGGALADRFDRRTYLALGAVGQLLLAILLTVLAFTHQLSVPVVAIVAFLNGCIGQLTGPAFSALLAELVPPRDLHSALSLSSAQFNLGRVLGPLAAAAMLASGGIAWTLLINALSFLAVLVALSRVRTQPPSSSKLSVPGLVEDIGRGMKAAHQDAGISLMLISTLVVAVLIAPFIGLVPVFAIRVFGQGASATSMLVTCQGAGAVLAAVGGGVLVDAFGRKRVLEGVLLALGPITALYWLAPSLPLAGVGIFLLGAGYMLCLTGVHTTVQSRAPREMQARISSLYSMLLSGGYALGVWLQGALADRLGVRFITVSASIFFLALVLSLRLLRPRIFDATEA
ncbi:MFS transporter [Hyalangium rubrum]|uniref:MFS transporter n=1 Tax=Hyalangium rubrum TaxID=3103134 RepID=A0ABU5HK14_9BACT|nr:MFS transporter [Hyalangium sp. s54d21]MDY7233188.1 MFS transporter [Hyalangium sp. s54d21]